MEIHVETRLLTNYVQTLSTLIGQIISKLTHDAKSDINVNLFRVDKFHVKSCFRSVYAVNQKHFSKMWMRSDEPTFSIFFFSNRFLENAS